MRWNGAGTYRDSEGYSRCLADQIWGLRGDHDGSSVSVAADKGGHDGGIDNSQSPDAAHAQILIHYGHGIVPHFAGTDRVVHGFGSLADAGGQVLFALRGAARAIFPSAIGREGLRLGQTARQPNALDQHTNVRGFRRMM